MEPGEFETIPMVRLRKRRLVDPHDAVVDRDAVEHVKALAAKGLVCILDLDGLRRNRADLDTLRKMGEKGNLWVDAGSRFATDAMDAIIAGGERVTIRWSSLASERELQEALGFAEAGALLLGVEFEQGRFVGNPLLPGDEGRVVDLARQHGIGIVVLDNTRAPGAGVDRALAGRFRDTGVARWYMGGARERDDALDLQSLGYHGVIVEEAGVQA